MTMNNLAQALNGQGKVCRGGGRGAVILDKTIAVPDMKEFVQQRNTVMFVLILITNNHNSMKTSIQYYICKTIYLPYPLSSNSSYYSPPDCLADS